MPVLTITKDNYHTEVLESDRPVLLDFWAAWCGPCKEVAPVIEEIAAQSPPFKVGKVNVEEQRELASAFRVMSVPTLIVVNRGEVQNRATGARPKEDILALLN